jgi:trans-aconitate methyltransferase
VPGNQEHQRGEFEGRTCSAPEARTVRMAEIVLGHVDRDLARRILDLGCGTGRLALRLAAALPQARVTGLDISAANIDAANAARAGHGDNARVDFTHADYLTFAGGRFDVLVTDGVLHLVPVDTATLVRKLSEDVNEGGTLVVCMPHRCLYNTAFAMTRRMLRAVRSEVLDRAVASVGRVLHPDASDEMLRERVHYIYRPPERVMDPALEASFAQSGLRRIATYPMPSTSLAQLRHSVTVWRKGKR